MATKTVTTTSETADTPAVASNRIPLLVQLPTLWKAMILTSFLLNLVLLAVVIGMLSFGVAWRSTLVGTGGNAQTFASDNVAELRDVVAGLQAATIKTTIPINQPLPLKGMGVSVPVDQETEVTLTAPVALNLSGADIDLGNGNRLRANNIALTLPEGTRLPIALQLNIPLDEVTIPVVLNVPVEIPLRDTELAPQFKRLGNVVDRLVYPLRDMLGLDVPPPAPPQLPKK